jgi:hypothetical protein
MKAGVITFLAAPAAAAALKAGNTSGTSTQQVLLEQLPSHSRCGTTATVAVFSLRDTPAAATRAGGGCGQ